MKKALPELTKKIESFDELNVGHKNDQSKEAPKEKKAAGRGAGGAIDGHRMQDTREYASPSMFGRGRGSAQVERAPHDFVNQVVDDSKTTVGFAQEKGSNPCTKCGFEHAVDAGCARNDNQRIRYDTSGPLVHRILELNDRDEKYKLCGEMIASLTKGAVRRSHIREGLRATMSRRTRRSRNRSSIRQAKLARLMWTRSKYLRTLSKVHGQWALHPGGGDRNMSQQRLPVQAQ
jgi:hypothetical protein